MYDNNSNQVPNMNNGMPSQKKKSKTKYIAALLILACGILLIVIGGALAASYDFSDFKREDITRDFSKYNDSISHISLDTAFSDVKIVKGDNLKVECKNAVKDLLDIDYTGSGTLKIDIVNKKSNGWFMTFSIVPFFNTDNADLFGEITITVPERVLNSIKTETSFGKCEIDGIDLYSLEIDNVFGEVVLKNINCRKYNKLENTFGDISVSNCLLAEVKAENTFGEIKMDKCSVSGDSKFEVTFGDLKADLYGNIYDYEFGCETVMGSSKINGEEPNYYKNRIKDSLDKGIWSFIYEMETEVTFGDVKINFDDANKPDITPFDSGISSNDNKPVTDKDGDIADTNGNKIVP